MQRRILYSIFGVLLFVHGCDDGDGPGSGRDATGPTPDMGTSVLDGKVTNSDGGLDQGTGTRPDSGSDPDMALGADSGEGSDAGPVTDAQPVTDASNLDAGPRPLDGGGRVDGGPVLADGGEADAQQVGCLPPATHLRFSTWPAVFQNRCTNCHLEGGFAEQYEEDPSSFVLQDPNDLSRGRTVDAIFQHNLEQIIAHVNDDMGRPLLVAKALLERPHVGMQQFNENGPEHQALLELFDLYERYQSPDCTEVADDIPNYREIFNRVIERTPEDTYRAFTIQTLGRLPTEAEIRHIRFGQPGERPMLGPDAQGMRPDNMRPDDGAGGIGQVLESREALQIRVVAELMDVAAQTPRYRNWLKDMWNDVFMFRGIHAQDLDRAYEVFNPHDYGARLWADLCDRWTAPTDDEGNYLDQPGRQRLCNVLASRFDYREVGQPNADNGNSYSGQDILSPADACDFCRFSRRGIAELMMYGAIEEPLELIASTIQEGRRFTEIVTSQDIMMNYYTSMVYFGTADPAQNEFTADMDDVPLVDGFKNGPNFVVFDVSLPDHRHFKRFSRMRMTGFRADERRLPNATEPIREVYYKGREQFPRAGILTSTAFMKRFPSNNFNLHRHRAWQTMRLFLGYDVLNNQGARISLADVDDPNGGVTITNGDCASCHHKLDPVAGLFRDFHPSGHSRDVERAEEEWSDVIHAPGFPTDFDTEEVTPHDRDAHGPPIRFLAERIAAEPRFATTMVKYAWRHVMGSDPMSEIGDLEAPAYEMRTTLLTAQDRFFRGLVAGFVRENYDMAWVYKRLFTSTWYRAHGLVEAQDDGVPDAVYEGIGRHGTLTPEEYFRRIEAVYGGAWPLNAIPTSDTRADSIEERYKRDFFTRRDSFYKNFDMFFGMLDASFSSFFGGIDFQNSLTRAQQINSVMSLLARRVANEFACLTVYADLKKPPDERLFFPDIPALGPRGELADEAAVRSNLVHLIKRFWGKAVRDNDGDVNLALDLYENVRQSVLADIEANPELGVLMMDHCRIHEGAARDDQTGVIHRDPDGQVRAWMAVVTYLMLQPEFLQR